MELFPSTAKSHILHFHSQRNQHVSHVPGNVEHCLKMRTHEVYHIKYKFAFCSFCLSVNLREFRFAQTMIFAIEEINKSEFLLPNVSIGYRIYDNCGSTLFSMRAVMALMNGDNWSVVKSCSGQSAVHAIIGQSESSSTIVLSRTTGPFKIPVVSSMSMCINVCFICNLILSLCIIR